MKLFIDNQKVTEGGPHDIIEYLVVWAMPDAVQQIDDKSVKEIGEDVREYMQGVVEGVMNVFGQSSKDKINVRLEDFDAVFTFSV